MCNDSNGLLLGMVRHYGCQFIISTHSHFLLSTPGATIYDMDSLPIMTYRWTEVPSVRLFHDFFEERREEFIA